MRKWRVGTVSMGIILIATGLLLLISELNGINGARIILRWWPVILIILGIEVLAYLGLSKSSGEEQPKLKFDGLSIFLTIFIVLFSSGAYAASSFLNSGFSSILLNEYGLYEHETVLNKNYDIKAAGVGKLQISNTQGEILVEKTTGDKILIDAAITIKSNGNEDTEKLAQSLIEITEGETLKVNTRTVGALQGNNHYQVTVDYVIKVPKELSYTVNNSYGQITMKDLTGNADVQGEYGAIAISRIAGDVKIRNSYAETMVSDISGLVDITNQNGEIIYSADQAAQNDITLNAEMGSITLKLPAGQQGTIKADSEMGDIVLEGFASGLKLISEEPENEENTNKKLEGSIGNKSPVITLHSNQGSIYLQNS